MPQFFPHEKLEVYAHALSFAKLSAALIDSWPSIMAVCDQLDRATESIVTNLAKAARLRATENGIYCLECLREVMAMLGGLRGYLGAEG